MKPVFDYHRHAYVFLIDQYWHANEENEKLTVYLFITDFSSVQFRKKKIMKNPEYVYV